MLVRVAYAVAHDSVNVNNELHLLNLYGFARSEMYVNSRENYEAKGGIISLYPTPVELDDYGFDNNDKVNAAFLEYIDIFRPRHAYSFINYKKHSFLIGQTWHPYYDGILNRSPQVRYELSLRPKIKLTAAFVSDARKGINLEAVIGLSGRVNRWKYGFMGEYVV